MHNYMCTMHKFMCTLYRNNEEGDGRDLAG